MKKRIYYLYTSLIAALLLTGSTYKSSGDYLMIYNNSSTLSYFKFGEGLYVDYFLANKYSVNNIAYSIRVRQYFRNNSNVTYRSDTAYFRKGNGNFYSFDKESKKESILLPVKPKLGQKWTEADGSWSYKVVNLNQTFSTPAKNYEGCVLVRCEQVTGRDRDKSAVYHLYYSKGNGYVGNVDYNSNIILSYLKKVKYDVKPGTEVGVE